jgi:hypothetical protein
MMYVSAERLDRRRLHRQGVLRRARVVTGTAVFNCFVLDRSPAGVRIDVGCPIALPDQVLLQFDDQPGIPACVRWSLGTEAGLAFGPAA